MKDAVLARSLTVVGDTVTLREAEPELKQVSRHELQLLGVAMSTDEDTALRRLALLKSNSLEVSETRRMLFSAITSPVDGQNNVCAIK